ncbi:Spc98 family-domain-containing protein [Multifurca ochricompacta]|uniref:Spindle pole body component n=1 Tax=Multifurca ochricompacta TaxID=376703 RepID=A0AAD4MDI4_9AGAM|nr:Spc98 family-domain-containing protein [Multifurca ochricompacta]
MPRIISLGHTLISQITGLHPDREDGDFRTMMSMVTRSVDYNMKAAPSSSMSDIAKHAHGARIHSQDSWAEAFELLFSLLKSQAEKMNDIDSEITLAHLPDHLAFLLLLSAPPTQLNVEHAENYLQNIRAPHVDTVTWKNILDEEPFEGQHWEGVYGLPPGSTVEGWETRSLDSTPPYSPLPLEEFGEFSPSLSSMDSLPAVESELPIKGDVNAAPATILSTSFGRRQLIEDLQRRQYWRIEWQTDAPSIPPFAIKDSFSLGATTYIYEHDAVREILMAFQGYKNSFLRWARAENGTFSFEAYAPRIIHLTRATQLSAVQPFARIASTVEHLRRFVTCVSGRSENLNSRITTHFCRVTRTIEAFSEAVHIQISRFSSWCAAREWIGPPLIVSFLNLEKTVRDSFSCTFDALLEILRKVMNKASRSQDKNMEVWMLLDLPTWFTPFSISSLLLDTLLATADSSSSNGDRETSQALMQDPALRQEAYGLTGLNDEFFIQDNGLSVLDPDFWTEGFTIREADPKAYSPKSKTLLLNPMANHILRAGKAVGLLRVLDLPLSSDANPELNWVTKWPTFAALLQEYHAEALVETSEVHLSRFIYDTILPYCQIPQKRLAQMAAGECDLWLHLTAIEELYFMRKSDAMSYFSDLVFAKMDSRQTWSDFHFLNNTFRDTVQKYSVNWIEPTLVRFSYSGTRDKALRRTVDALDDLVVEYAAPFPLTYLFGCMLLMCRAKNALGPAIKIIFALRGKLIWFINFVAIHVVHRHLHRFHDSLKLAESLDEMIGLHNSHLQKLENECLLQSNTVALRQAILSILDITLRFHDTLIAHQGEATAIAGAPSRVSYQFHYNWQDQQARKDEIGFALPWGEAVQTSGSDSDVEETLRLSSLTSRAYLIPSVSRDVQQLFDNIYDMQKELEKLVRLVRREVESLAGGTPGGASAFSILAFSLEDWDR